MWFKYPVQRINNFLAKYKFDSPPYFEFSFGYDHEVEDIFVEGYIEKTDLELETEIHACEQRQKDTEKQERAQYEKLAAKYGGK